MKDSKRQSLKLHKSRARARRSNKFLLKVAPFRSPIITKGKGNWVWDIDGNKYLDMMSGQFCLAFGHSYQPFTDALLKQLKVITHTNTLTNTDQTLSALEALAGVSSGSIHKGILLSTGAEAVECAIRYAKQFTGKDGMVAVREGYHGLTLGTQGISSGGIYAHPHIDNTFFISAPTDSETNIRLLKETYKKHLMRHKDSIAAIIVEPVISVGGMIFLNDQFFKILKELATELNALLIFDECQTGMGRTGDWFAYQHLKVVPDIVVLGKILGNGLPVSAVLVKDEVAKKIENSLIHFSSHQNDPLSAACVSFVINEITKRRLLVNVRKKGKKLLSELTRLSKKEPWLLKPRGRGLMIGFDIPEFLFTEKRNLGLELIKILEERGVLVQAIRRGRTFRILPSFLITDLEVSFFIHMLEESFLDLHVQYDA